MGITGLLQFPPVKQVTVEEQLPNFSGKTAAADVSGWIHKALSISAFGDYDSYTKHVWRYVRLLKSNGVTPILVFNGQNTEAKFEENDKRERERQKRIEKLALLVKEGRIKDAEILRSSTAVNDKELHKRLIIRCREENILYCVGLYEADPQLAFMVSSGLADFVITEDSDLLAYGCQQTLFKLRLSGTCQSVHLSKVLESLKISKEEFTDLCIQAGCDYCKLPGVGIKKAHSILNAAAKKERLY